MKLPNDIRADEQELQDEIQEDTTDLEQKLEDLDEQERDSDWNGRVHNESPSKFDIEQM